MSLRDLILTAAIPTATVETPEWLPACPRVTIRGLSAKDHLDYVTTLRSRAAAGKPTSGGLLVSRIVADENGNRLFTDDDADALDQTHAYAIERIVTAWLALMKIDPKSLEDDLKNSSSPPSAS